MPNSNIVLTLTPESSQIHGYGWENGTLALEFKSNHEKVRYHYPFTPEQFAAFEAAESKGKHFYAHIKKQYADEGSFERLYKDAAPADSAGGEAA